MCVCQGIASDATQGAAGDAPQGIAEDVALLHKALPKTSYSLVYKQFPGSRETLQGGFLECFELFFLTVFRQFHGQMFYQKSL